MQNIYDNYTFFSNYKSLRETDNNYNVLLEQPAMMNLIPNIKNKTAMNSTILSLQQDYGLEKYVRYPGMTWTYRRRIYDEYIYACNGFNAIERCKHNGFAVRYKC